MILNKANGWQATDTGLPKRLNGREALYTWTEQNVLGYRLQNVSTTGTVTTSRTKCSGCLRFRKT